MSPSIVELDIQQLEAQLDEIEQAVGAAKCRPLRLLLGAHVSLLQLLQEKNLSLDRLRRLLFGAGTERTRNLPQAAAAPDPVAVAPGFG